MTDQTPAQVLASLAVFQDVPGDVIAALAQNTFIQVFPGATVLVEALQPATFMFCVIEGHIELGFARGNTESIFDVVPAGQAVLMAEAALNCPAAATARTSDRAKLAMIGADAFRRTYKASPSVQQVVAKNSMTRELHLARRLMEQHMRDSTERVALHIFRLWHAQGKPVSIKFPWQKRATARFLAMTPENFSRAIGTLQHKGAVANPHARRIDVIEPDRLLEAAGGWLPVVDGEPIHV